MKQKSLLFILLIALFAPWAANAQTVTIGEGTSTGSFNPIATYFNYSFTEQLYLASEINQSGTILSLGFNYASSTAKDFPVQIYMKAVDLTDLTSAIGIADSDLVFDGTLSATAGWVTVELDTPFAYNGTQNLLIAVNRGYVHWFSGETWYYTLKDNMAYYAQNDDNVYTPTSSLPDMETTRQRPNVQLTFGTPPSCVKPSNIATNNITTNSAELSWTAQNGETAWTVYYKKSSDTDYTSVAATTNPYTLENLDVATTYEFYVVANCSATDQSEASEVYSFTTECEVFSAYPYTENFDSYDVPNAYDPSTRTLPTCWSAINTTTYSSYAAYPSMYYYSYSNYANSTPNCLRFNSYYDTDYDLQPQYAILPEMENLAGKQITLWVRDFNATGTFKIGTMTDPTDASTFETIAPEKALTASYQEFIFTVPASTTAHYITIMIDAPTSSRTFIDVYIDDITIDNPPACPKPSEIAISDVTAHTAVLDWIENGEASEWTVEYALDNTFEQYTSATATDTTITLQGLVESTTYYVRVKAVCGDDDESEYSNVMSFHTPLACPAPTGLAVSDITNHEATLTWTGTSDSYDVMYRTAAYTEGLLEQFNNQDLPSGWMNYSGLLAEVIAGEAELSSNSSWVTTPETFGIYNVKLNIYGNDRHHWLVTPEITLNNGTDLSFDLALTKYNSDNDASGECTDDRFVVLVYANETWSILREWNNSGSADVFNNIATTGENVSISLANYVNQTVKIAFYGESTVSDNGDNDLHIDNVGVGTYHAAGEWQTIEDVTATTCTLEGLEAETDYEVKVVSSCEGETGHETAVSNFTTDVACPTPTEVEVSNITYNSANLAWTGYNDSYNITYQTPATLGDTIFTEDFSGDIDDWTLQNCDANTGVDEEDVFMFNYNSNPPQYLISPEITGITEDAILEFTYDNYSSTWEETFQVGLSSTDNNTESFTWSETITASDTQVHTYHATVPAGTKYMAIKLLSDDKYYLYIDDIVIAQQVAAGDPVTVTSEEEAVTLTDLTPNTEYEVKVQGVCGETETEWTEIVSFTTLTPSFTKEIAAYTEDGGYYLIASPLAADVAPTAVTGMITDDLGAEATSETSTYDLYSFDQTQELEWQNYRNSTFDLVNGTGYLYASKEGTTLTFSGTPYSGDGSVTLTKNDEADFAGWNLIGNPFADTAYIEVPFYTMNGEGSEIVAAAADAIEPMEGVFVIAENDGDVVTFSTTAPNKKGSMLALNLSQGRGTIDRAIVSFDEGQTLPKLQLRETSTKVYIPVDGTDYAVVRSEGTGELPVNFKAEKNGSYTLSFSKDEVEFSYLHLIDNLTGTDVDLLAQPSYSFEASTTDDDSRFTLVFATDSSTITLGQGWSWFSSHVEFNNRLLGQLQNGVAANGSSGMIKSFGSGFVSYAGGAWSGSLNELNIEEMYLVSSDGGEITLCGALADPEEHPITLANGWNWIGFLSAEAMTVTEALAGITPNTNDMIKGQEGFAAYDGSSWRPEFNMVPGQGYLYMRNGAGTTLVYPSTSRGVAETTPMETFWNTDHHAFPTNLTMMVTLDEDVFGMAEGSHEVGAFVDGECRGSARLTNVDGKHIAFLTVSGEDAETVSFRLYDVNTGSVCGVAEESISYKSDDIYGNVENPMVLHFRNTGLDELGSAVSLIPNPAKDKVLVSGDGIQTLKVYNAMGQLLHAEDCADAEQVTLSLSGYSAGIYTVSVVTADGQTVNKKIVKE